MLEKIFSNTKLLISAHCEDETTIKNNLAKYIAQYGDDIPVALHPIIRSEEACYISSSRAIELAKKTGARLHVFHLSTEKETHLFDKKKKLADKKITAEVCIHHLWFTDEDYTSKGTKIKWNPAVKTQKDKDGLWKALLEDRIDVVATDHAPHTLEEKKQAQDWDQYRNQKFSELINEEIEIGDNSTVGLGLEPQEQRIAAEFPNG